MRTRLRSSALDLRPSAVTAVEVGSPHDAGDGELERELRVVHELLEELQVGGRGIR